MHLSIGAPGIIAEAVLHESGALSLHLRDATGRIIASGLASEDDAVVPEVGEAGTWQERHDRTVQRIHSPRAAAG